MQLSRGDLQRIKDQAKNIKFMQPGEVSPTGETKSIKFTSEAEVLEAFYINLKHRDIKFWEDNKEILILIKNQIMNNINRRKLNKGD